MAWCMVWCGIAGKVIPLRCDHARDDEVYAVLAKVREEAGRLDVLVNNAFQVRARMVLASRIQMSTAHRMID